MRVWVRRNLPGIMPPLEVPGTFALVLVELGAGMLLRVRGDGHHVVVSADEHLADPAVLEANWTLVS